MEQGTSFWWRDAVIYQVYPRSFADSNGDGVGDLEGIRSRIPYLKDLGIDAIWLTPFYTSPQVDHGYDVADFMNVDSLFGDLNDFDRLMSDAKAANIRVIVDIVPNHSSDQHDWFQSALMSIPGSRERARYLFRDGKGEHGELPPNNWKSVFGGPAWTRIREQDGTLGQWYLHLFAPGQPDFDWENPEVHQYFEKVLRFWLDRGVDGFRIDVAAGMVKAHGLPDQEGEEGAKLLEYKPQPMWDQDGVHDIFRHWRKILDSYPGQRMAVSEAWIGSAERMARYVRPDEMMQTFNFDFLGTKWNLADMKATITKSIEAVREVGAPPSWVINNHDVARSVDRYDRDLNPGGGTTRERYGDPKKVNLIRGQRRARAGALLMFALPGGCYMFEGEELALPDVQDIPDDRRQDPVWTQSNHLDVGRDGCRVPIPWTISAAGAFGFSNRTDLTPDQAWLPQPAGWGRFSVQAQQNDATSSLEMYRKALKIRKAHDDLGEGDLNFVSLGKNVLAISRGKRFLSMTNFGRWRKKIPAGYVLLHSSAPLERGKIPTDTTVWLQREK